MRIVFFFVAYCDDVAVLCCFYEVGFIPFGWSLNWSVKLRISWGQVLHQQHEFRCCKFRDLFGLDLGLPATLFVVGPGAVHQRWSSWSYKHGRLWIDTYWHQYPKTIPKPSKTKTVFFLLGQNSIACFKSTCLRMNDGGKPMQSVKPVRWRPSSATWRCGVLWLWHPMAMTKKKVWTNKLQTYETW